MKIREKGLEIAAMLVGGAVAAFAAVGFSSPKDKFDDHEKRINGIEIHQHESDKMFVRMDQKLDDLIDGLGVRRRHR